MSNAERAALITTSTTIAGAVLLGLGGWVAAGGGSSYLQAVLASLGTALLLFAALVLLDRVLQRSLGERVDAIGQRAVQAHDELTRVADEVRIVRELVDRTVLERRAAAGSNEEPPEQRSAHADSAPTRTAVTAVDNEEPQAEPSCHAEDPAARSTDGFTSGSGDLHPNLVGMRDSPAHVVDPAAPVCIPSSANRPGPGPDPGVGRVGRPTAAPAASGRALEDPAFTARVPPAAEQPPAENDEGVQPGASEIDAELPPAESEESVLWREACAERPQPAPSRAGRFAVAYEKEVRIEDRAAGIWLTADRMWVAARWFPGGDGSYLLQIRHLCDDSDVIAEESLSPQGKCMALFDDELRCLWKANERPGCTATSLVDQLMRTVESLPPLTGERSPYRDHGTVFPGPTLRLTGSFLENRSGPPLRLKIDELTRLPIQSPPGHETGWVQADRWVRYLATRPDRRPDVWDAGSTARALDRVRMRQEELANDPTTSLLTLSELALTVCGDTEVSLGDDSDLRTFTSIFDLSEWNKLTEVRTYRAAKTPVIMVGTNPTRGWGDTRYRLFMGNLTSRQAELLRGIPGGDPVLPAPKLGGASGDVCVVGRDFVALLNEHAMPLEEVIPRTGAGLRAKIKLYQRADAADDRKAEYDSDAAATEAGQESLTRRARWWRRRNEKAAAK